ncbi:MAG: tRNA pseudouridine(38-40) synthase TruA [Verrucomicrobiota bacterium]
MRWKCGCSYDGTDYFGWQTQEGQMSAQQMIEETLEGIFKSRVPIQGSGRTDTGVHAEEQVFHFDFDWEHGGEKMKKAIYSRLPKDIRVNYVEEVSDDFHSRFSAKAKRYRYQLFMGTADPFAWRYCWSVPERVNLNTMKEAMSLLVGEHDFAALAANRGVDYESTVRTITHAAIELENGYVNLSFQADGFMYKMVRTLAGTLVNVGLGRIGVEDVQNFLDTKKRTAMAFVAPARGLFLERVFY